MTGITNAYDFALGADSDSAAINLNDLPTKVHYPKTAWHPYAAVVDLDDNSQRGVGLPSVVWSWSTITQEERDQLRTYCQGASAHVKIVTRTNDDSSEFEAYLATMIWPSLQEEYDARTRQGFSITFRQMTVDT